VKVRLTKRFARRLDGIDLSHVRPGDVLDLPADDARMLLLEGVGPYPKCASDVADPGRSTGRMQQTP
jgi:hypothetical protein